MNQRNFVVGFASIAVIVVAIIAGVYFFKSGETEKFERTDELTMPMPAPERTPGTPALRRVGPEPSHAVQRHCREKYPADAVARRACKQGVIGISNAELDRQLDDAWNKGLR